MSGYDDDLRVALDGEFSDNRLREVGDGTAEFALLAQAFPTLHSRIDWGRVPGAITFELADDESAHELIQQFIVSLQGKYDLVGPVTFVGDSATGVALQGEIGTFVRILKLLLEVPQHHYFVGAGARWCLCITFEGDVGFGFSPAFLGSTEGGG